MKSPAPPATPELLDARAVAQILGCGRSCAYEHMKAMPHFKVGKMLRVARADLDAWLAARRRAPAPSPATLRETPQAQRRVRERLKRAQREGAKPPLIPLTRTPDLLPGPTPHRGSRSR